MASTQKVSKGYRLYKILWLLGMAVRKKIGIKGKNVKGDKVNHHKQDKKHISGLYT